MATFGRFHALFAHACDLQVEASRLERSTPLTDQIAHDAQILRAAAEVLERMAISDGEHMKALREKGFELRKIEDKPQGFE
jgi:hypothetical protein